MPIKVTDPNLISQLEQKTQQPREQARVAAGLPGQDSRVIQDPNLVSQLNQRRAELDDDSWGAYFGDLAFSLKGLGYGVGDELADVLPGGLSREEYKAREELARMRSPIGSLIGEIAAGIGTDVALYTGIGAAAGSVVPGAGTAAGGGTGAVVGIGKGLWRAGGSINRALQSANKAKRAAAFAGLGAVHGGAYGFGETEGGFQERLKGAGNAAALGAAFGPAAVYGGAGVQRVGQALRGTPGQARSIAGRTLSNNPRVQYAIAQDMARNIRSAMPKILPGVNKSSFAAAMSDATGNAAYAVEAKTKQLYRDLDNANIQVDIRPWTKQVRKAAGRYANLPGGAKAANTLATLGKSTKGKLSLEDTRFVREQLHGIKHILKPADFDLLYKNITSVMSKGAADRGKADIFRQADDFYKGSRQLLKQQMFKQGLSEQGFKPAIVRQAVIGENQGQFLEAIKYHLDELQSLGQDTTQLRYDLKGLTANELLKKDGRVLRDLVENSPDAGRAHLMALTGDPGLTSMLIELGKAPKGRAGQAESLFSPFQGLGPYIGIGTFGGVDPLFLVGGIIAEFGRRKFMNALIDNPRVQKKVREFVQKTKSKKMTQAQAEVAVNSLRSELLATGLVGTGLYNFSEDIPEWVWEPFGSPNNPSTNNNNGTAV